MSDAVQRGRSRVLRRRRRDPEGRMALVDHLREFRRRLVVCATAVLVTSIVAGFNYDKVFTFLAEPFEDYKRSNPRSTISLNFGEATSAFSNLVTLSVFVGVIASSPIWLYQIWAFIVPGLTRREKRVSLAFVAAIVPLFLTGCYFGYAILPNSLHLLYGFSPPGTSNIQQVSNYFAFVTRFILVFGIGFLFPVVLVALSAVGVLSARRMLAGWRVAVVGIFIFAAIATPTADPFTMLLLGMPLIGLYFAACGIARLIDRKRQRDKPEWLDLPDDEASPL